MLKGTSKPVELFTVDVDLALITEKRKVMNLDLPKKKA